MALYGAYDAARFGGSLVADAFAFGAASGLAGGGAFALDASACLADLSGYNSACWGVALGGVSVAIALAPIAVALGIATGPIATGLAGSGGLGWFLGAMATGASTGTAIANAESQANSSWRRDYPAVSGC